MTDADALRAAVVLAVLLAVLLAAACGRPDDESPIINEDVPVIDIAQSTRHRADQDPDARPDRAGATGGHALVPASEPWEWTRDQSLEPLPQEETGRRRGVGRDLRNLVSRHRLHDPEWEVVFPAVRQLAAEAGLNNICRPAELARQSRRADSAATTAARWCFGSEEATDQGPHRVPPASAGGFVPSGDLGGHRGGAPLRRRGWTWSPRRRPRAAPGWPTASPARVGGVEDRPAAGFLEVHRHPGRPGRAGCAPT